MRINVRDQRIDPPLVRGEYFSWPLTAPDDVDVPDLSGAGLRFAVGVDPESPIVEVTDVLSANGQVTNPAGLQILVELNEDATALLTGDRDHRWTLYVTLSSKTYVWAKGNVMVEFGAGEL